MTAFKQRQKQASTRLHGSYTVRNTSIIKRGISAEDKAVKLTQMNYWPQLTLVSTLTNGYISPQKSLF